MAENGNATENNSVDIKQEDDSENEASSDNRTYFSDYRVMPGSQLDSKQIFTDLLGKTVKAKPVLVDFKRLLQVGKADSKNGVIDGISNQELLHAVVGLYDVSLSEMTPDVLYSTVCEKWARTVVLVRDTQEVLEEVKNRKNMCADSEQVDSNSAESSAGDSETEEVSAAGDKDAYEPEESKPSVFCGVFSDTEDEEEEEEESDEEDFSVGINAFIKEASTRRKKRKENKDVKEEDIGVESRLLGCATFEKKFVNHKDRVIHLTLIAVRERFRNFGIGKYLLSLVTSQNVVGSYEAVVVHADNAALKFFQKYGFSDDVVLNSRFSELAEQFTNCTLMCYLPGFSGSTLLKTACVPGIEFFELELDFNKWKDKTLEAYQAQVGLVMRMKHEVLQLKSVVKAQSELLTQIAMENNKLKMEKLAIERDFISYRLSKATSQSLTLHSKFEELNHHDDDENDDICTEELIEDLQRQVDMMQASLQGKYLHAVSSDGGNIHKVTSIGSSNYVSFPNICVRSQQDPYDHTQDATMFYNITENFIQSMKSDPNVKTSYEVTSVAKATLSEDVKENFNRSRQKLHNCDLVTELYYCGSLERPMRIPEILRHGFSEEDFTHGDYGRGLYFSKQPSTAAQFSALGKLLLAEVGLGTVETVIKEDRTRKRPKDGFDSIITPGRLGMDACGNDEFSLYQEYIVFDESQVKPICLISYQAAT
ncbi:uncharacterized protein LOC121375513 [Gigantopelta aegis]|uniref:uncharacterized protein LOC121375513 n=1 Tax=Gigantopelta aegis TaxID=1735272 RepID=UPI001B88CEDD|nr:uncharacterized protein LOC121375513 [Gigantopelta aegis]